MLLIIFLYLLLLSRKAWLQPKSRVNEHLNGIDCNFSATPAILFFFKHLFALFQIRNMSGRGINYFYCLFISQVVFFLLQCTNLELVYMSIFGTRKMINKNIEALNCMLAQNSDRVPKIEFLSYYSAVLEKTVADKKS